MIASTPIVWHQCIMYVYPSDIAPSYAPNGQALVSVSTQGLTLVDEKKLTQHLLHELTDWFGEEVKTWQHLRTYHS
ncbi:MAG: hypothetical protein R2822_28945 [Spirosomataceae bacterium]